MSSNVDEAPGAHAAPPLHGDTDQVHGTGHAHRDHGHSHGQSMTKGKLRTAFLLTVLILAVEVAGGLLSNSLALLADAGHVLTDLVALGLAWFATAQAERPADARRTYGYHRTGILAALVNAATLLLIVVWIAYEALQRFQRPEAVTPWLMFVAAAVGVAVNLYIGFGLRAEGGDNLNVRAAMLHVFGDVGASAAVILGGLVIALTGWYPADPLISLVIAVLIAHWAWAILRETVDILMEATPRDVNVAQLVRDLVRLPRVCDIHDLPVWSIAGGLRMLSAHVQFDEDRPLSACAQDVAAINALLQSRHRISHATIQLEYAGCDPEGQNGLYCTLPTDTSSEASHGTRGQQGEQDERLADHVHDGLHRHRHSDEEREGR